LSEKLWIKLARKIVGVGLVPFAVSDNLLEFMKILMNEEQAEFLVKVFRKPSLNMDQIKEKTDLQEDEILKMLDSLMDGGILSGTRSRNTGIMVYALMPLFPGIIEYSLMKGETGEKQKKLAALFEKISDELNEGMQRNMENLLPQYKNFNPISRTVPVEEFVEVGQERVLLSEDVYKLVDHYDPIALAHCYCKQEKDLVGDPCKVTDTREICLIFDKAAEFSIERGFAKKISREDAKKKLKEAEDCGLVHKVFHSKLDLNRELDGICSCCKCCCGIFRMYYKGSMPLYTLSTYIAKPLSDKCIGCGTCVEKCPMETISLENDVAVINEEKCIGCGVCAHLCPEEAIKIERTGPREVFVPPPKVGNTT